MENCVIYSNVSILLSAAILPAKTFNIFKAVWWVSFLPALYHFVSFITCHLLLSVSIFLSQSVLPFSLLVKSTPCYPFRICFLCSVLSSLFAVRCGCGSTLSGSGRAEKLTKAALLGFTGRCTAWLWSWILNIHIYLHCGGMDERRKARNGWVKAH